MSKKPSCRCHSLYPPSVLRDLTAHGVLAVIKFIQSNNMSVSERPRRAIRSLYIVYKMRQNEYERIDRRERQRKAESTHKTR